MAALQLATTVSTVDSETGAAFAARRAAIGMSIAALAKRAGVDRGSLAALEDGRRVRDTTVAAVDRVLRDIEEELGMDVPSQVAEHAEPAVTPLKFTIHDVYGVGEIIAEGPADRPDELVAAVAKLLAEIQGGSN